MERPLRLSSSRLIACPLPQFSEHRWPKQHSRYDVFFQFDPLFVFSLIMAPAPSSVSMNFIHPELTAVATINEEPTYASIHRAQTQLHDNAVAVFTSAGGSAHGHLALAMTVAEYLATAKVAFKVPVNPTTVPVMVKASKMESTENVYLHEVSRQKGLQTLPQCGQGLAQPAHCCDAGHLSPRAARPVSRICQHIMSRDHHSSLRNIWRDLPIRS
jgi:hypothetical protein